MGRPRGRQNYDYFCDEEGYMHCPCDGCDYRCDKKAPDVDRKTAEYKQWREQAKAECRRHIKRVHDQAEEYGSPSYRVEPYPTQKPSNSVSPAPQMSPEFKFESVTTMNGEVTIQQLYEYVLSMHHVMNQNATFWREESDRNRLEREQRRKEMNEFSEMFVKLQLQVDQLTKIVEQIQTDKKEAENVENLLNMHPNPIQQ